MNKLKKEIIAFTIKRVFKSVMCVYINKKDYFILLKKATLYPKKILSKVRKGGGIDRKGITYNRKGYDCIIVHKDKVFLLEPQKDIEYYLTKYEKNIRNSPEILINNILKDKKLKIRYPSYITPIKNFFREVGIIPEKRGIGDKLTEGKKHFQGIIINEYIRLGSPKRYPIKILSKILNDEVNLEFPQDNRTAQKYSWCDRTIREVLNIYNKDIKRKK